MARLLVLLVVTLNGCALASQLPSLKYCNDVSYQRVGRAITISAHCFEAVEPMAIPGIK